MYKGDTLVSNVYETFSELSREIFDLYLSSGENYDISIITKGNFETSLLVSDLVRCGLDIDHGNLKDEYSIDENHDEYLIKINRIGITIEPFYNDSMKKYYSNICNVAYISDNANSKIFKSIQYLNKAVCFSIDENSEE